MIKIEITNKKVIREIQRNKVETEKILAKVMKSIAADLLLYSYRDFEYTMFYYHLLNGRI